MKNLILITFIAQIIFCQITDLIFSNDISDGTLNKESNSLKLDIKEIDLGVYFLQIYLDNNIVSGSFVKK